jgi:hypothetical protein
VRFRLAILALMLSAASAAHADRRVAFIIGNAAYRNAPTLQNPSGMIISYATQAGSTAADGRGRNSPYTMAFFKNIELSFLSTEQGAAPSSPTLGT